MTTAKSRIAVIVFAFVTLIILVGLSIYFSPGARSSRAAKRGDAFMAKSKVRKAITEYREALRLSVDPMVQYRLAVALLRVRQREEAISTLRGLAARHDEVSNYAKVVLAKLDTDVTSPTSDPKQVRPANAMKGGP